MVRYILNLSPLHSITYKVLSSLDMLNVEDRVRQLRLNHVYNIYHGRAPPYLEENFILRSAVSSKNTRASSNEDFFIPHVKTCQADTFYFNGIKDWNALPSSIKCTAGKITFKKQVKSFILQKGILENESEMCHY